jgi:hypothetical protein
MLRDQVPEVAVEVLEDGRRAVGLLGGRADEADALGGEGVVIAPEVSVWRNRSEARSHHGAMASTEPPAWLPMKAACSGVSGAARTA